MVSTRVLGRVLFGALSLGVVCGSLPSCGSSSKSTPKAKACTMNSDCDSPLVCGLQRCHSACRETRDCPNPNTERCVFTSDGEICQLPDEAKCHYNSDCKDPKLVCAIDGVCRSQCQGDVDCPSKQECLKPDLVCVAPSELNSDGKLTPADGGVVSGEGGAGNSNGNGGSGGSQGGKSGGGSGGTEAITDNAGAAAVTDGGTGSKCPLGLGDCDNNPADCETDLTLITSCGACSVVCHPSHGPVRCDAALLKCIVAGPCDSGYADCNHDGQDGCESMPATDPNNCGACGHTCGGGTCTAGQCSAPIFLDPSKALTAGLTYNGSGDTFLIGGAVGKLNINDGTEIRVATLPISAKTVAGTILVSSSSPIYSAAVDSTNLYYAIGGSPASILYKPLTGGAATAAKVAATLPSHTLAYTMTPDGTSLYIYAGYDGSGFLPVGGNSILTAQQGSTAATLIPGLSGLYDMYSPMVIVGGNLFWVGNNNASNDLYTAPLGGGTPVLIAHLGDVFRLPFLLADDGKYVYWITSQGASSKVQRVAAKGSPTAASVVDIAVGLNAPAQANVVADANYVYYLEGFQVYRVKNDGSLSPEPLALVNAAPNIYNLFAVDDAFVYGTGSGGQIVGVAKDALGQ